MALIGQFNLLGMQCPSAYAKIMTVSGSARGLVGAVSIWPTTPTPITMDYPDAFPAPAQQMSVNTDYVPGEDAFVTLYKALAALPAFAQMTSDAPTHILSKLTFMQRFTAAERQDILTLRKTMVQVEDWYEQMNNASYIDLARVDTQANVNALTQVPSSRADGSMVLTAARATAILTP